jgi:hypothetical protein
MFRKRTPNEAPTLWIATTGPAQHAGDESIRDSSGVLGERQFGDAVRGLCGELKYAALAVVRIGTVA